IFQITLVIRTHEAEIFTLFIQADHMYHTVGNDPHDLAFLSSAGRCRGYDIFYFIPLKCAGYILLRDKYILAAVFRCHEPEAPCIRLESSFQMHGMSFAVFPSL